MTDSMVFWDSHRPQYSKFTDCGLLPGRIEHAERTSGRAMAANNLSSDFSLGIFKKLEAIVPYMSIIA